MKKWTCRPVGFACVLVMALSLIGCERPTPETGGEPRRDLRGVDDPGSWIDRRPAASDEPGSVAAAASANVSSPLEDMEKRLQDGDLFGAIEGLREAIGRHSEFDDLRRELHDALRLVELNREADGHAETLIRRRQFDPWLLMARDERDVRRESNEPLIPFTARDSRAKIGSVRRSLDVGDYETALSEARSILRVHPEFGPAHRAVLVALTGLGRWARVEDVLRESPPGVRGDAAWWTALGGLAVERNAVDAAADAFLAAARAEPDDVRTWTSLAGVACAVSDGHPVATLCTGDGRHAVDRRIDDLRELARLRKIALAGEDEPGGSALAMAKIHRRLGHPWMAEAWASISLTMPGEHHGDARRFRGGVVRELRRDTPWQITDGRAEFPPVHAADPQITLARVFTEEPSEPIGRIRYRLANEAAVRGLAFFGRTGDDLATPGVRLYQTTGCGGGTIDYDRDGWDDLVLMAAGGTPPNADSSPSSLFRNRGGEFEDVTGTAGAGDRGFGQGVTAADLNGDGFGDLVMTNYGTDVRLMNNGDGTFRRESFEASESWSTSVASADWDGDGLGDLMVLGYCDGLGPVVEDCARDRDGVSRACAPVRFPAAADRLFRNDGSGGWEDVSGAWGFEPAERGRGLGLLITPVAGDERGDAPETRGSLTGVPMLGGLVANDMTPNHFWVRTDGGSGPTPGPVALVDVAAVRGLASGEAKPNEGSMGIAASDFDGDGRLDVYVTNFITETNTLHLQRRPGFWSDRTDAAGGGRSTEMLVGFGTVATDLDADGVRELLFTNGHVDDYSISNPAATYAQPMRVWRTDGGRMIDVSDQVEGDYLRRPHIGRALWTVDADGDGHADLAVTHQSEPVALLMNRTPGRGRSEQFDLVGVACDRDAVGTRIRVMAGDRSSVAARTSGDGYLCSDRPTIDFGLGGYDGPYRVECHWTDGTVQTFDMPAVEEGASGSRWLIVQGEPEPHRLD